jgi:hypothetical protein
MEFNGAYSDLSVSKTAFHCGGVPVKPAPAKVDAHFLARMQSPHDLEAPILDHTVPPHSRMTNAEQVAG